MPEQNNKMRTILLSIVIGLGLLAGCSKSNDRHDPNTLVGDWRYLSTSGGIAGRIYPAKDLQILTLKPDKQYLLVENLHLIGKGIYSLGYIVTLPGKDSTPSITLYSSHENKYFVNNDTLVIGDWANDGFADLYVRWR